MKLRTLTAIIEGEYREVWSCTLKLTEEGSGTTDILLVSPYKRSGLTPDPIDQRAQDVARTFNTMVMAIIEAGRPPPQDQEPESTGERRTGGLTIVKP